MDWLASSEHWGTRVLLQRSIGAVYLIAFVSALNQFRPLLGSTGLLPVPHFLRRVPFRKAPSIFHLHYSDRFATVVAGAGAVLAAAVVAGLSDWGPSWVPLSTWLVMWALYLSIVNVGQAFYSFAWESLLLEAGFLAAFLGPSNAAPPVVVIWLLRWLLFRVELGAGLIKLRRDTCWRDLTCLRYHHETQPMPNRMSWRFHHLPDWAHKAEVVGNHIAQLVIPFGLFLPQPGASVAGAAIIVTQCWLLLSGNFSWLNALTIALAFSAFDDTWLPGSSPTDLGSNPVWQEGAVLVLAVGVAVLSIGPVRNMLSTDQRMNANFNRLHLVNSYGAFGHITRVRNEVVVEGTDAAKIDDATTWREYEFKGKPGDPQRRPRQVAPYHLRLDWVMWFAALSPQRGRPWFRPLAGRLLANDPATLRLMGPNPFPGRPPTFVRARLYRYRFSTRAERRETGAVWVRSLAGEYLAPLRLRGSDRRTDG